MVKVYNKSNRPLGIAGKPVLPDKELVLKDKEVFCAVYDEDGNPTGERQIIPGLKALEVAGLCTITVEEEQKTETVKKTTRTRKKKEDPVKVEEEAE